MIAILADPGSRLAKLLILQGADIKAGVVQTNELEIEGFKERIRQIDATYARQAYLRS